MFGRKRKNHSDSSYDRDSYMLSPDQYLDRLGEGKFEPEPLPRKRRSRIGRLFVAFVALCVVAIVAYGIYLGSIVAKVSTQPLDFTPLAADANGRTNVLVLGTGDPGHAGQNLSDTIMVISYDRTGKRTAQISLPRDLRVNIPGHGRYKINQANSLGGVILASQTVSDTLGIPIHYVVSTDFNGLSEIVDAVGGIDVTVQERLYDPEYPCDDNQYKACGIDIPAGPMHMDGATALKYVRCRKGTCGNDFGRAERQQEVLNLTRDKMLDWHTLANPGRLIPLVAALRSALSTDMGAVQLAQFALGWQQSKANAPIRLVLSTSPGGYLVNAAGSSDLLPADGSFGAIRERVQGIFTIPAADTDLPE